MKVGPIRAITLLVFRPKRFETLAVNHAVWLNQQTGPQVNAQVCGSRTVRRALGVLLLLVAAAILVGCVSGIVLLSWCGPPSVNTSRALQYVGVGILLWATLGKQGWNIQTLNGNTLPELVDRWVYRTLYILGSYVLVLSVAWSR